MYLLLLFLDLGHLLIKGINFSEIIKQNFLVGPFLEIYNEVGRSILSAAGLIIILKYGSFLKSR